MYLETCNSLVLAVYTTHCVGVNIVILLLFNSIFLNFLFCLPSLILCNIMRKYPVEQTSLILPCLWEFCLSEESSRHAFKKIIWTQYSTYVFFHWNIFFFYFLSPLPTIFIYFYVVGNFTLVFALYCQGRKMFSINEAFRLIQASLWMDTLFLGSVTDLCPVRWLAVIHGVDELSLLYQARYCWL